MLRSCRITLTSDRDPIEPLLILYICHTKILIRNEADLIAFLLRCYEDHNKILITYSGFPCVNHPWSSVIKRIVAVDCKESGFPADARILCNQPRWGGWLQRIRVSRCKPGSSVIRPPQPIDYRGSGFPGGNPTPDPLQSTASGRLITKDPSFLCGPRSSAINGFKSFDYRGSGFAGAIEIPWNNKWDISNT